MNLVQKLSLANLLMNLVEFARADGQSEGSKEFIPLSSLQDMLLSRSTSDSLKEFIFGSVLDWLLHLEHIPRSYGN